MKYIGMDAHSRNSYFVILDRRGCTLKKHRTETNEADLLRFIRSIRGKRKLIFEESAISQWLYLLLKDEVNEIVVCQPGKQRGPKTDWIDAKALAESIRINSYLQVFHSDDVLMEVRTLVSGYRDLVQELVQMKNRYCALYRQAAIRPSVRGGLYRSEEHIPLLPTESMRFVAGPLLERIWLLERQKSDYESRFEANVKRHKAIRLLTTIPGIAAVRANQIAGIVVSPHRFPSKYKFFAYAMLVNHHKRSDGKKYGKERPFGQSLLKEVFKTATLSALRGRNRFRRYYEASMSKGLDDRRARNGVARLIAATALGVWKSEKKYNDKYMEVTQRLNRGCHSGAESL